jgi:accessory colonization factor AcfC
MTVQTVGRYLNRWGFTLKRPAKKAHEQNPESVKVFKNTTYQEIRAKAQKESGIIIYLDESGLHSNSNVTRAYSPCGKRCYSDLSAQKFSKNIIIALAENGKITYKTYDQTMNTDLYIKFVETLIGQYTKKIFLVADNLRVYHARKLNE